MKATLLIFCLALVMIGGAVAQPSPAQLLDRLLAIADPDQLQAYRQLNLTSEQVEQLRGAAAGFMPRVEQMRDMPGGPLMLVPEALRRVDGILTPAQRPLARRLVPRAHQWTKLKALFQEYRDG